MLQALCHEHDVHHFMRACARDALGKDADVVTIVVATVGAQHVWLEI